MIIFVPKGNNNDAARQRNFYDQTYYYLKEIGIDKKIDIDF